MDNQSHRALVEKVAQAIRMEIFQGIAQLWKISTGFILMGLNTQRLTPQKKPLSRTPHMDKHKAGTLRLGEHPAGVKIKDLEWERWTGRSVAYAMFGGSYVITEYEGMPDPFSLRSQGFHDIRCDFPTLEAAKYAAQVDYDARIMSAIIPTANKKYFSDQADDLEDNTVWVNQAGFSALAQLMMGAASSIRTLAAIETE